MHLFRLHQKKEYLKGVLTALSCAFCILAGSIVLDLGYNYALRGEFARHSSDTRFITTVVFYTASRNDSEYIEESSIKDLFWKYMTSVMITGI